MVRLYKAINNIKLSQKKKVNTLIFLLFNQMCVVTFGRKRILIGLILRAVYISFVFCQC